MRGGRISGPPTISMIIADYIQEQQKPVHYSEVIKPILDRRGDLRSKNIAATVRSIIQRSPLFIKTDRGTYDLNKK